MATAINVTKKFKNNDLLPNPLNRANIPLYRAQDAAQRAVSILWFPRYSAQYIDSLEEIKRLALRGYDRSYKAIAALVELIRNGLKNLHFQKGEPYRKISDALEALSECLRSIASEAYLLAEPTASKIRDAIFPFNPIKGRRQFLLIPRSIEKTLGDYLIYPLATNGFFETSECLALTRERMAERIKNVTKMVVAANQDLLNPKGETPFDYRVKTLDSYDLNAFATAGGGMVVFSKLVKELQGAIESHEIQKGCVTLADGSKVTIDLRGINLSDVLAALIAHEATHVGSRHTCAGIVLELVWSVLFRAIEFLVPYNYTLHRIMIDGKRLIDNLFSRKNEYECDVAGAFMADKARFNVIGALYLQEFFSKKESEWSNFFHRHMEFNFTHPHSENRKRALFAAIREFAPEKLSPRILKWESPFQPKK